MWNYLLRGSLPKKQRRTLTFFFWVIAKLHQKTFEESKLIKLLEEVNVAMALLERDCPLWLGNITTHILRHIAEKLSENGPMYASWMYPFERMNSYITRRANNRSTIEQCIMETVQV